MKTAKIFQNGQSQAVRIPKAFRLIGKKVFIKKLGKATLLLPIENPWESLFDSLDKFSSDFMDKRMQPKQTREEIFI